MTAPNASKIDPDDDRRVRRIDARMFDDPSDPRLYVAIETLDDEEAAA